MSLTFITHSLRQITPKTAIRERDRRSGAYPVKSKTGDRTRTGRNNIYFDDARTVLYLTGVNVSYPTTQQFDPNWVGSDLTGTLGDVVGNVDSYAVDQFIVPSSQIELAGPFIESNLYEQDETNIVNSKFMTGAAYGIAPDKYKSKISNKTALRMEFPLNTVSTLSVDSSSLHYFNPSIGKFEKVVDEVSLCMNGGAVPSTFAPILFTPYGFHYLPLSDSLINGFGGSGGISVDAKNAYKRITTYAGDGSDAPFFSPNVGFSSIYVTASLLNPRHAGHTTQSVSMTPYLSHPFLLEKMVVEFPFQAGPGWLNDRFGIREALANDLEYTIDAGGPMITFALLRQDGTDGSLRDLISSGTITTAMDMTTGSYQVITSTYAGIGGYSDIVITPEGVGYFINPSVVITGSVLSGSDNFYTGSIKLIMEPQITSHVWRQRVSGSAVFYLGVGTANGGPARSTQANGLTFGPIARRSSKNMESGRSILGNQFALIPPDELDGTIHQIAPMDTQYEDGEQDSVAPRFFKSKTYYDVVSKTIKSPYLLYPEDRLVFALSKHRSVGVKDAAKWDIITNDLAYPLNLTSYHDVAIGTGLMKITLYGDLIKDDHEFHDTLNQRLETEEIWQDIGEDPVLDQFDISYRSELSGSYVDRFNVLNTLTYANDVLTPTLEFIQLYSNFTSKIQDRSISNTAAWIKGKQIYELAKSSKNAQFISTNEIFWDTRLVNPVQALKIANANFAVCATDAVFSNTSAVIYTGTDQTLSSGISSSGQGVSEWFMGFPYESKFEDVSSTFELGKDIMPVNFGIKTIFSYNDIAFEFGDTVNRALMVGNFGSDSVSDVITQPKNEFIKYFYGIGDGYGKRDNQHVRGRLAGTAGNSTQVALSSARIRGWKYGMINGFTQHTKQIYRRDRYGQPRDLLEQRLDSKIYDEVGLASDGTFNGVVGVKTAPVQVHFYDSEGKQTDALKTLSSNVSFEATSSVPYIDGIFRNRPEYDFSILNIKNIVI